MSCIIPKSGIDSIKPYKGGSHNISEEKMINLASNESSIGPSPNVIKSLNNINITNSRQQIYKKVYKSLTNV